MHQHPLPLFLRMHGCGRVVGESAQVRVFICVVLRGRGLEVCGCCSEDGSARGGEVYIRLHVRTDVDSPECLNGVASVQLHEPIVRPAPGTGYVHDRCTGRSTNGIKHHNPFSRRERAAIEDDRSE